MQLYLVLTMVAKRFIQSSLATPSAEEGGAQTSLLGYKIFIHCLVSFRMI